MLEIITDKDTYNVNKFLCITIYWPKTKKDCLNINLTHLDR